MPQYSGLEVTSLSLDSNSLHDLNFIIPSAK